MAKTPAQKKPAAKPEEEDDGVGPKGDPGSDDLSAPVDEALDPEAEKELRAFYKANPDAMRKWVDTDATAFGAFPDAEDNDEEDDEDLDLEDENGEESEDVVDNAFCPTGEGGGIDPTCSPHKAAARGYSADEFNPPPKLFRAIQPGNGGEHLDHVVIPERQGLHGPHVKHVGPGDFDYELKGREIREAGGETVFRPVHPDEPHTLRDHMWPKGGLRGASGGDPENTSPPNVSGISKKAIKYWETSGTAKGEKEGEWPQHSIIREAADKHLGVTPAPTSPVKIGRLTPEESHELAKNLIQSIAKSSPSQPTLWRGVDKDHAKHLKQMGNGDTVVFSLGSTSRDAGVAYEYAGSGTTEDAALMRILPGSRGVAVTGTKLSHDQEVITGGKFRVVGKSVSKSGITVIDLEQVEVHQWN